MKYKKGFTLLEILLVIAAIGVLAAIVIIAVNPQRQINQVQEAESISEVNTITKATEQYLIDNGSYPLGLTSVYQEICPTENLTVFDDLAANGIDCTGKIDLRTLVPTYVAAIPEDGDDGYLISQNPSNDRVSVQRFTPALDGSPIGTNIINLASGDVEWVSSPDGDAYAYSVDVDAVGNAYVAGEFTGTITWQGVAPISLSSPSSPAAYIAKFSPDGQVIWARQIDATGFAWGHEITISGDSLFLAGIYNGVATFGAGETNETQFVNTVNRSSFLARYNPTTGDLDWVTNIASNAGRLVSYRLLEDSQGDIYQVGYFWNQWRFNAGQPSEITLTSLNDYWNAFVVKYDSNGVPLWGRQLEANAFTAFFGADIDSSDNLYLSGEIIGTASLIGGSTPFSVPLQVSGGDQVLLKLNPSGDVLWRQEAASGDQFVWATNVHVDQDQNAHLVGGFTGNLTLSVGTSRQQSITSVGERTLIRSIYNPNGEFIRVDELASGANALYFDYSTLDVQGDLTIASWFHPQATIAPNSTSPQVVTSVAPDNQFVAKFSNDGDLKWVRGIYSNTSVSPYGYRVVSDDWGNVFLAGHVEGTVTIGTNEQNETTLVPSGFASSFLVRFKY